MIEEIPPKPIPIKNAFIWIFLFTVTVSGSIVLSYLYYNYSLERRMSDPVYCIDTIEHSIYNKKMLPTPFISEILGLSIDKPTNIYRFSAAEGAQKLLQSSLISGCQIKKKMPSTLLINYKVRTPIAYLSDYDDMLIDGTGIIFPRKPFFPTLDLPKIYFGECLHGGEESHSVRGLPCEERHFSLGRSALEFVQNLDDVKLVEIDLSNAYTPSFGRREIIFIFENSAESSRHIVRCNTQSYQTELLYYRKLIASGEVNREGQTQVIIDMRIPKLAFVKE